MGTRRATRTTHRLGTRRAATPTPPHRALAAKTAQTLERQIPWKAQTRPDPGLQKRRKPSLRLKRPRWSEKVQKVEQQGLNGKGEDSTSSGSAETTPNPQ